MDININTDNQRTKTVYRTLVACLFMMFLSGIGYHYWFTHHPAIYAFNQERDMESVLALFHKDFYWLVSSYDYSPEFTFKYLSPKRNPHYFGKLKVNVLRQGNNLIGFVAYFMVSPEVGQLLFLAIDNQFRRKKYGELLFRYGLEQLIRMGSKKIIVLVRTNNIPAQELYKRFGCYEVSRDDAVVTFEYDPSKKIR